MKIDILPPDPLPPPGESRSSLSSTRSSPPRSPGRSTGLSGSTRSAIPKCSKSASARGQGAARLHPAQPGLCVEHAHLPRLDGRHVARAADDRHPLPAQPDQAHPQARRGGGKFWQGAADAARLPPRAAPRRCGARASPSSRCASASSARSNSARRCCPASATISGPSSPASSCNWRFSDRSRMSRRSTATSTTCSRCSKAISTSRAARPQEDPGRFDLAGYFRNARRRRRS